MSGIINNILNSEKKILVIGDVMLDQYVSGDIHRLSQEASVPIMVNEKVDYKLGGAANVCINIHSLGGKVDIMGCIGNDLSGEKLLDMLQANQISTDHIFKLNGKITTVKTRYMSNLGRHILRVDHECYYEYTEPDEVLKHFENIVDQYEVIVLSDYNKGFLNSQLTREILLSAKKRNKITIVDPKSETIEKYKDSYLIKPNKNEFQQFYGGNEISIEYILNHSEEILNTLNLERLLITCSEQGIIYLCHGGKSFHQPAFCRQVTDVTGAGDIVTAILALGYTYGLSEVESITLANKCAGISVEKRGTSLVDLDDLLRVLSPQYKILDGMHLLPLLRTYYKKKKIVFTNGCFDLLHAGHLDLLKRSKQLGDILVVGLNSDVSINRLKGTERPICNQDNRILILSMISEVDWIIPFDEDDPLLLIKALCPDVLVKGDDYQKEQVIGGDFVESYGGHVALIHRKYEMSTTEIINHIKAGSVL